MCVCHFGVLMLRFVNINDVKEIKIINLRKKGLCEKKK